MDIHKDFRLYITTKLPNPAYTPEIFARAAIIDFTVTIKGNHLLQFKQIISNTKIEYLLFFSYIYRIRRSIIGKSYFNRKKRIRNRKNAIDSRCNCKQ